VVFFVRVGVSATLAVKGSYVNEEVLQFVPLLASTFFPIVPVLAGMFLLIDDWPGGMSNASLQDEQSPGGPEGLPGSAREASGEE